MLLLLGDRERSAGRRLVSGRGGELERRRLVEDLRLERPEDGSRLKAELTILVRAGAGVGLQRLGLASAAVEREHQLGGQAFAGRVGGDQVDEFADEGAVAPDGEVSVDPGLERGEALFLETGDLGRGERFKGEVGERRPPPEREAFPEDRGGALRVIAGERSASVIEQPDETLGIEVTGPQPQLVAGRRRGEQTRVAERLAQAGDMDVDRLQGAAGGVVAPERNGEAVGTDRLVGVEQQVGEDGAWLDAPQGDRAMLVVRFERAKDPELHQ